MIFLATKTLTTSRSHNMLINVNMICLVVIEDIKTVPKKYLIMIS